MGIERPVSSSSLRINPPRTSADVIRPVRISLRSATLSNDISWRNCSQANGLQRLAPAHRIGLIRPRYIIVRCTSIVLSYSCRSEKLRSIEVKRLTLTGESARDHHLETSFEPFVKPLCSEAEYFRQSQQTAEDIKHHHHS